MRAVIQRVRHAQVISDSTLAGEIEKGYLIFLGIEHEDDAEDARWLAEKIINMRIMSDDEGKMNLTLHERNADALVVSQFTLHASTKKGNRPSFIRSAKPDKAIPLYDYFIEHLTLLLGKRIQTGVFGTDMQVSLVNDGPVTIILDSKNKE